MLVASCWADAALRCEGIRFIHLGRNRTRGLDCIGLLVVSGQDIGLLSDDYDTGTYPGMADPARLLGGMKAGGLARIDICEPEPGLVMLFRYGNNPQHLAIATYDSCFVHAYQAAGKVCVSRLDRRWARRLGGYYRALDLWYCFDG